MKPETFDRSKPLYRVFDNDGILDWWTVELDGTPGRQLREDEISLVERMVARSAWAVSFYDALERHQKATVYASIVEPYTVPEGCTALLRHARFVDIGDQSIVVGAIYGDRHKRWEDGHFIHTSAITEGPDSAGIIKTLNSVYKLEMRQV